VPAFFLISEEFVETVVDEKVLRFPLREITPRSYLHGSLFPQFFFYFHHNIDFSAKGLQA
jgi:hypothetical protein